MKFLLVFLVFFSIETFSHPVIWKGGTEFIMVSQENKYDFSALYSFNRSMAAGVRLIEDYNQSTVYAQLNNRFLRFNRYKEQENVYGLLGLGVKNNASLLYLGLQWDWETQQNFSMVTIDHYSDEGLEARFRFGIAPYVGGFDVIHTWFMLEYRYNSDVDQKNTVIPIVRFFQSSYLLEFGAGEDYFITLMIHL